MTPQSTLSTSWAPSSPQNLISSLTKEAQQRKHNLRQTSQSTRPSSPPASPSEKKVIGCKLSTLQDLYAFRTLRRAGRSVANPSNPEKKLSPQAGGCGPSRSKPHATRKLQLAPGAPLTRPPHINTAHCLVNISLF